MSGGSFDYLYSKDIGDLMENPSTLDDMIVELEAYPYASEFRQELINYQTMLCKYARELESKHSHLKKCMRSFEWFQSCDTSEKDFKDDILEWGRDR